MSFRIIFAIMAVVMSGLAQENAPKLEKTGFGWFYYEGVQQCDRAWDKAIADRDSAFRVLEEKIEADQDVPKIRFYVDRARAAQREVDSVWDSSSDYIGNLRRVLPHVQDGSATSRMTAAEREQALGLIKTLESKLEDEPVSQAQLSTWKKAMRVIGVKPSDALYKSMPTAFILCADGTEQVDSRCDDGSEKH